MGTVIQTRNPPSPENEWKWTTRVERKKEGQQQGRLGWVQVETHRRTGGISLRIGWWGDVGEAERRHR